MPTTPADLISEHDKEKRLEEEKSILEAAQNMDDPKNSARVTAWLVKEQIEAGRLLRVIVSTLPDYQTKEGCADAMQACPASVVLKKYKTGGALGVVGLSSGGTVSVAAICYTILRLKGLI